MSVKQDLIDSERQVALERARMGAKQYDEWVKSQQVTYFTSFSNKKEIQEIMSKVGYDFVKISTDKFYYLKTHIGISDWDCIWWIEEHGKMQAVVNIDVNKNYMQKFIKRVENYLGKKYFYDNFDEKLTPVPEYTFPTIFTDIRVLKSALDNLGILANIQGNSFNFKLDNNNVSIYKVEGINYEFKIVGKCDLVKIHKYFKNIETEYNKIVQLNTCRNIKKKIAENSTMKLEQEEILEDNSVLLTIRI